MKAIPFSHFILCLSLVCLLSSGLAACGQGQIGLPVRTATAVIPTLASAQPENFLPTLSESAITPAQPAPTTAPTLTPEPSPTAAPVLRQLTTGGCCAQAFWAPDGSQVRYLDKPAPEAEAGIWGISRQGGASELVTNRLGIFSNDLQLIAYPEARQTIVEQLADGQRWVIPSQGRAVSFSPDGAWVAWTAGQTGPPFDTARREVWVSRVDGTEPQLVQVVTNGGFSGWLPDGRLLISGKLAASEEQTGIFIITPGGSLQEVARSERLRGLLLSPGGTWLAYQVTFSSDPAQDGTWLVNTQTLERVKVPAFGAYRWRDDNRLLLIPLDLTQPAHQLWQFSAAENSYQPLTDPAALAYRVANNDWSVSPDGQAVAFLSASDLNIWLLELP